MSDSWHHARALAARLQEELPEDASLDPALAARLELTVVGALERRRVLRARRRTLFGATSVALVASAAAAFLLVGASPRASAPHPIARAVIPAMTLLRGELARVDGDHGEEPELSPGSIPAARELRSGPSTIVQLTPASHVELRHALVVVESVGRTASFVLESGELAANASGPDERVAVRMADVQVEGVSADFDVERSGGGCGQPVVHARRGQVTVSAGGAHRVLEPGTTWSSCPVTPPAAVASSGTPTRAAPSAPASSSLEDQNDALSAAVAARRSGRTTEALRLYGAFLQRWPSGPLAEVARADRMNLLATQDPAAARRAAQDYLRRHPDGPARERARTLAGEKL